MWRYHTFSMSLVCSLHLILSDSLWEWLMEWVIKCFLTNKKGSCLMFEFLKALFYIMGCSSKPLQLVLNINLPDDIEISELCVEDNIIYWKEGENKFYLQLSVSQPAGGGFIYWGSSDKKDEMYFSPEESTNFILIWTLITQRIFVHHLQR